MMTYARKLALLLFTPWVALVITVVFVTLQRSHRSLQDVRRDLVLQRFLQLPQRLLAPPRAPPNPASGEVIRDPKVMQPPQPPRILAPQGGRSAVASAPPEQGAMMTLQPITTHRQGSDWCYRLESSEAIAHYRQFSLAAPARWVIDLPGRWRLSDTKAQHFSKGPVQSLVVGHHPQHLRVVFWVRSGMPSPVISVHAGQLIVKFVMSPITN